MTLAGLPAPSGKACTAAGLTGKPVPQALQDAPRAWHGFGFGASQGPAGKERPEEGCGRSRVRKPATPRYRLRDVQPATARCLLYFQ